jgi:hypothetical protein
MPLSSSHLHGVMKVRMLVHVKYAPGLIETKVVVLFSIRSSVRSLNVTLGRFDERSWGITRFIRNLDFHKRVALGKLELTQVLRFRVAPLAKYENALSRRYAPLTPRGVAIAISARFTHFRLLRSTVEFAQDRNSAVSALQIASLNVLGLARLIVCQGI